MASRSRRTTNGRAPGGSAPESKPSDEELTPRGARTKAGLLEAARTVFERDGFINARITDIAEEANVAHGTFYTYFTDKEDVFKAVVAMLPGEFLGEAARRSEPPEPRPVGETPYEAIHRANRHYYDTYTDRGRMMGILEQVATFNEEFRALRREVRRKFVERSERSIRRWQAEGICDPLIDAHYAASALGSMVDRSIYIWLVLEEPHDPDPAIETLSRLWANALGLPVPDPPPATAAKTGRRRSSGSRRPSAAAASAGAGGRRPAR